MIFQDEFLEETTQEQATTTKCSEDSIVKMLEKLVECQQNKDKKGIKKVAERVVLEKFEEFKENSGACQ
ncbi:hypothetical protein HF086_007837 [Spodoptera exigua]|uniref:Uncharacterized protein n=1 Tax=Spodoptera exigua TaxID=7107 RepID=A0A922M1L4_SPOEX|nr:hypothetical protein HF086_007837 [Spodoptera exigua]